jgi:hypothetical protein
LKDKARDVVEMATFTHSVKTRANQVKFAHQSLCNPKVSTLLKAVRKGFLKGYPNLTEKLILKYLNPSPATTKGHMKRPRHGIKSTGPKPKGDSRIDRVPIINFPPQEKKIGARGIYCRATTASAKHHEPNKPDQRQ